ncbi:hypothetical protein J5N97_002218 [Dioscorea zingiberensis]|uniref:SPRY domain-containing protein n=1 Tax=Dioscorea zingiberensis TaxID=325984 RepID=A0A9D5D3W1_9LILI|nr:hypothetical protein J5N97_002218 [Dioscorea zingiberensis]
MKQWVELLFAGLVLGGPILFFPFLLLVYCCCRRQQTSMKTTINFTDPVTTTSHSEKLEAGLSKFNLPLSNSNSNSNSNPKDKLRFHQRHEHHHQHHYHQRHAFHWDEHPRLITDAAENGWSRFAFCCLTSSRSSQYWSLCGTVQQHEVDYDDDDNNWDIPLGASESMQIVKLNPSISSSSYAKMSLPLPGPPLSISSSFPQEAYFEITILNLQMNAVHHNRPVSKQHSKSDRMKLIQDNSFQDQSDLDELSQSGYFASPTSRSEAVVFSLGLSVDVVGGIPPTKSSMLPGTYPGSIGFHSNGSVHLDGMKLVFESERTEWGGVNRVIGLGFNPRKKKVLLTVDSELVHIIHCNSDAYKSPLYPVLAANDAGVTVLVNMGQRGFRYAPANAQRTPNPCFFRSPAAPDVTTPGAASMLGSEDSRELFSVGTLGSEKYDIATMNSVNNSSSKKSGNATDAESDLFEIVL